MFMLHKSPDPHRYLTTQSIMPKKITEDIYLSDGNRYFFIEPACEKIRSFNSNSNVFPSTIPTVFSLS